jgi:hypothetical protein
MYFFPVYIAGIIPALAALLPGISLRSIIVLVPVANVSVAVREILTGRPDPLMIGFTAVIMTATAAMLMRRSATMLCREDIVVAAQTEPPPTVGGSQLFQKHVLRWFAVIWAIIFAVAAGIPELATLRGQIIFNELIVFLGVSLLIIRIYRLDVGEALALRPVKPAVWLAVFAAIPCCSVVAYVVFRLLNSLIPVSQRMSEAFAQAVFPPDMPSWQI